VSGRRVASVAFKPPRYSFEQDTPTGKFPVIEDGELQTTNTGITSSIWRSMAK
jgi:hypothetical protein